MAALDHFLVGVVFLSGAFTFSALFFVSAPYGRHARGGWGPRIPSRWAWIFMESPSVAFFAWIYSRGNAATEVVPLVFFVLWQAHYLHRTLVYPVRTYRSFSHQTPLLVAALGFAFNLLNSYLNAHWISELGHYTPRWLTDPRFIVGVSLFLSGYLINRWADEVLRRLKRAGGGYKIPRGGLYERISCPNYFGEVLEWTGWAVATWSLAGLSFAFFTAANLVPRAVTHHRWYHETFPDYPSDRKAIFPWIW